MDYFNLERALVNANAILQNRTKNRTNSYDLYYSNNERNHEGKISGLTIKQLVGEFRALGTSYRYAFITKRGDAKVLRFYNSNVSKKFFSLTRKGRKSK